MCVCVLTERSLAVDRYVDANTTNTVQSGVSWATAYTTIKQALDDTSSNLRIFVAEGTYKPNVVTGHPRRSTFRIDHALEIYGGFVPSDNFNEPRERDLARHESILSGDIGTVDDPYDNTYHVVVFRTVGPTAIFDGFTVRDGRADVIDDGLSQAEPSDRGGGVLVRIHTEDPDPSADIGPVIQNCTIEGNFARTSGGGLATMGDSAAKEEMVNNSNPTIQTTVFRENSADDDTWTTSRQAIGGGIYVAGGMPRLVNCAIVANTARRTGAGVLVDFGASIIMHGCTVADNALLEVDDFGSTELFRPAGVHTYDHDGVFAAGEDLQSVFVNSIFWGNHDTDDTESSSGEQVWANDLNYSYVDPNVELALRRCCIQDLATLTNDNIADDPEFVGSGDYRLSLGSPLHRFGQCRCSIDFHLGQLSAGHLRRRCRHDHRWQSMGIHA